MDPNEKVYREVCDAENLEAFIKDLPAHALRQLSAHLDGKPLSGIPGLVRSLATIEQASRWAAQDTT